MPTLADLTEMIRKAGGTPLNGTAFEDDYMVQIGSVETYGPNTYGHPRYFVQYFKDTGWLTGDLNGKRVEKYTPWLNAPAETD